MEGLCCEVYVLGEEKDNRVGGETQWVRVLAA